MLVVNWKAAFYTVEFNILIKLGKKKFKHYYTLGRQKFGLNVDNGQKI
jgi:hypothetical protein